MPHLANRASAIRHERTESHVAAWSGELHGPVAEMHRTIEAAWRLDQAGAILVAPQTQPVEGALRWLSRAVGWAALAAALIVTGLLVF